MLNRILKSQIEKGTIFHSYIFEGSKKEVVEQYELFAKLLLRIDGDVGNFLDIVSTSKSRIPISEIRELTKRIFKSPSTHQYNIIVIEDAHLMGVESQNALLKTIEDIPSYSILIMTTNNRFRILNTIISRSQTISIKRDVQAYDLTLYMNILSLIQNALNGSYYIINKQKTVFKDMSEKKEESLLIITDIFSSLMIDKPNYFDKSLKNCNLSKSSLEKIILEIENIKNLLKFNINFQLSIESLIFEIIEKNKR